MSIGSVSSTVSSAQANAGDQVGMTVLKKAIDQDAQQAQQLIAAIPQPPQNQPTPGATVGGTINTYA